MAGASRKQQVALVKHTQRSGRRSGSYIWGAGHLREIRLGNGEQFEMSAQSFCLDDIMRLFILIRVFFGIYGLGLKQSTMQLMMTLF